MVMLVTAATRIIVMMMLMVVIVTAAAFVIMVVMMVLVLLVIVTAAALVVVMMMVMMLFLFYLRKVDDGTFHRIEYFLTTQYFNRCGNNVCFRIQFAEHFYSCLYFFRIGFIGTAQDDRAGCFYLILEEFTKVLHVNLAFGYICNCCIAVKLYFNFFCNILYSLDNI